VQAVRATSPSVAAALERATVLGMRGGRVRLGFVRGSVSVGQARAKAEQVSELLAAHFPALDGVVIEEVDEVPDSPRHRREEREAAALEARREGLLRHPIVRELERRFDGRVVSVEPSRDGA